MDALDPLESGLQKGGEMNKDSTKKVLVVVELEVPEIVRMVRLRDPKTFNDALSEVFTLKYMQELLARIEEAKKALNEETQPK